MNILNKLFRIKIRRVAIVFKKIQVYIARFQTLRAFTSLIKEKNINQRILQSSYGAILIDDFFICCLLCIYFIFKEEGRRGLEADWI